MARARNLATISTDRPGRSGRLSLDPQAREIQRTINREMRELGRVVHMPFVAAAPRKRGRLRRSITARVSFRNNRVSVTVGASVRSRRGFEYTNVTRFGHRRAVIYPRRKARLAFTYRGKHHVVHSVKGYRPSRDWVLNGIANAEGHVDHTQRRIERVLEIQVRDGVLR